ncbi:hypothetical protein [Sorangium sp. So ce861]|uniref:hypothetical protein n=1 Tax=Sorangium sp. So ce861 TaxID=3133323 RepID=UPI003F5E5A99
MYEAVRDSEAEPDLTRPMNAWAARKTKGCRKRCIRCEPLAAVGGMGRKEDEGLSEALRFPAHDLGGQLQLRGYDGQSWQAMPDSGT